MARTYMINKCRVGKNEPDNEIRKKIDLRYPSKSSGAELAVGGAPLQPYHRELL
jgi:hypothetical protein